MCLRQCSAFGPRRVCRQPGLLSLRSPRALPCGALFTSLSLIMRITDRADFFLCFCVCVCACVCVHCPGQQSSHPVPWRRPESPSSPPSIPSLKLRLYLAQLPSGLRLTQTIGTQQYGHRARTKILHRPERLPRL